MSLPRLLWSSGVSLGLLWLLIVAPLMVLGGLWGGTIPLWPPVVSGSRTDLIVWAVLFCAAYGLPPFSLALMFLGRAARRG
jgi:hypothetical protein